MSAPGKFDYSSPALDRPPYISNCAAQMERSSSFRELMEHPVPSQPNMLRGTSPIAQTNVVATDYKSIRPGDFKRHSLPSPIPEEIKRLKTGLGENNVKARERVKVLNEASSVFNKFFPSLPTKKRSQPGGLSGDRSGERLVSGSGLSKMGIQGPWLVVLSLTRRSWMNDLKLAFQMSEHVLLW
ncbi:unnamed protein product [Eruca vesicaria subsp. sativa]|uniref:Uncharacterized protein n=1 Tax=Eruca vesicaria subsp. sativa TaxID=29727 RepID=A0ABC8LGS3_ERUVS|nr:unnamed protein product [Eruca vesicaria subsp. sativa]